MAIDSRTIARILQLSFPENPKDHLSVKKIVEKLYEENKAGANWSVPCERTVQKCVTQAKERMAKEMSLDWDPWSILLSDKAGVPFDAILFKLLRFWFERQRKRGECPPFVPFSVGIAKWVVRLHKMDPLLSEKELLYGARQYMTKERMFILAGKLPESSYDDLEIAMKREKDQKRKADYEEFCGGKVIKAVGEELEITVPPDTMASRITPMPEKQKADKKRLRGKLPTWLKTTAKEE